MRFIKKTGDVEFIPPFYIGNMNKAGWLYCLRFTIFHRRICGIVEEEKNLKKEYEGSGISNFVWESNY